MPQQKVPGMVSFGAGVEGGWRWPGWEMERKIGNLAFIMDDWDFLYTSIMRSFFFSAISFLPFSVELRDGSKRRLD